MIRVLSGKYKNRKLKFFKYASIRPTKSRVKKSLFDSINSFEDKKVLDVPDTIEYKARKQFSKQSTLFSKIRNIEDGKRKET